MVNRALVFLMLYVVLCTAGGVLAEPVNLAPTPGFETPIAAEADPRALPFDWYHFTSGLTDIELTSACAHSGNQCVKLMTQKMPDSFKGLYTEIPVQEGVSYSFSIHALNNKNDPLSGAVYAMLVIEWKDANNNELARSESETYDRTLSRLRWTRLSLDHQPAPKGATKGIFGFHLIEDLPGSKGSVFIDDASITED